VTLGLCILVHAEPKTGKSWLAATAPKPILYLDVEGSSRFVPYIRPHAWTLGQDLPPFSQEDFKAGLSPWDVAVLKIRSVKEARRAYEYLRDRQHPFRSVVVDTFSELQKRIIDDTVGPDRKAETNDWDVLLRQSESLARQLRDLVEHPTRPLDVVAFMTHTWMRDGKQRPMVKGQFSITLPGFPDVIGYMYTATDEEDHLERRLAIQPVVDTWLVGDRTYQLSKRMGAVIKLPEYDGVTPPRTLEKMWRAMQPAQPTTDKETK
jgi:hypothetical protein